MTHCEEAVKTRTCFYIVSKENSEEKVIQRPNGWQNYRLLSPDVFEIEYSSGQDGNGPLDSVDVFSEESFGSLWFDNFEDAERALSGNPKNNSKKGCVMKLLDLKGKMEDAIEATDYEDPKAIVIYGDAARDIYESLSVILSDYIKD
jgi:hypothetical protein